MSHNFHQLLNICKNGWAYKCLFLAIWFHLPSSWLQSCLWVSWNIRSWIFIGGILCLSSEPLFIDSLIHQEITCFCHGHASFTTDCIRSHIFLPSFIISSPTGYFILLGLVLCCVLNSHQKSIQQHNHCLSTNITSEYRDSQSGCTEWNCR